MAELEEEDDRDYGCGDDEDRDQASQHRVQRRVEMWPFVLISNIELRWNLLLRRADRDMDWGSGLGVLHGEGLGWGRDQGKGAGLDRGLDRY